MTVAPHAPPLLCGNLDDAVAALRERGFRLTASRRLVLEALFAADGPVSAEYITARLRLDPTSVYRNLETLESQGLVRHVHLGHGPGLYALLGRGEHEYLFCEQCGAVKALTPEELNPIREQVKQRFGYQARFTHFAIVGTCLTCATEHPQEAAIGVTHEGSASTGPQPHTHEHDRSHADTQQSDEHAHAHSHGDRIHSHLHPH
jgi:Fur family ferric uptake transcriptional regulator